MGDSSVHVLVVCWENKELQAQTIASALLPFVDKLTVIYSNASNRKFCGAGEWVMAPNGFFYGKKFKYLLSYFSSDIGLLIQADAESNDWPDLVNQCRKSFACNSKLGVWVPHIDGTPFKPVYTDLWAVDSYYAVSIVDGITWAFSSSVANRLMGLDYSINNLGWGIESAAVSYCYSRGFTVLRSPRIEVVHEQGAGYSSEEALRQEKIFLKQLKFEEKVWYKIMRGYVRIASFSCNKLSSAKWLASTIKFISQAIIRTLYVVNLRIKD